MWMSTNLIIYILGQTIFLFLYLLMAQMYHNLTNTEMIPKDSLNCVNRPTVDLLSNLYILLLIFF